mmetsp:Transcript_9070/g.30221  ORF Transcript_9070/g.30221 Transcript_9070/m.30221 type:complete len:232 (-) Transcript_9070:1865-2560(-)
MREQGGRQPKQEAEGKAFKASKSSAVHDPQRLVDHQSIVAGHDVANSGQASLDADDAGGIERVSVPPHYPMSSLHLVAVHKTDAAVVPSCACYLRRDCVPVCQLQRGHEALAGEEGDLVGLDLVGMVVQEDHACAVQLPSIVHGQDCVPHLKLGDLSDPQTLCLHGIHFTVRGETAGAFLNALGQLLADDDVGDGLRAVDPSVGVGADAGSGDLMRRDIVGVSRYTGAWRL